MALHEVRLNDVTLDPFRLYRDDWGLVTAGKPGDFNTMTISWGSFGELWARPTVTVYVRHSRYTYQFTQREELFTVSFYGEEYRKVLSRLGTLSGRDIDKMGDSGLTPCELDGAIAFEEAKLVLVCRKLYSHPFVPEEFTAPEVDSQVYADRDYHRAYVGEILHVYTGD